MHNLAGYSPLLLEAWKVYLCQEMHIGLQIASLHGCMSLLKYGGFLSLTSWMQIDWESHKAGGELPFKRITAGTCKCSRTDKVAGMQAQGKLPIVRLTT